MQRDEIKELIKTMFGPNAMRLDQADWVMTQCPFAPWMHSSGKDRNPSFGISVKADSESNFHCFTCKAKGRLHNLPKRLAKVSRDKAWLAYHDDIPADESLGGKLPSWEQLGKKERRQQLGDPVPDSYLHVFDSAAGHPYLKERGIDDQAARGMDLRIDEDDHGVERILFPVYSRYGKFHGYTGRATHPDVNPKVRDYFGLPKRLLLLGSEHIEKHDDKIILVEGLFDYANLFQYGHAVVASLHANLTPQQANILKWWGKPVVVMYDNDRAGKQGRMVVKEQLGKHLPLMKVRYPKGCNDPGELTKNQLYRMLSDTRLL